MKNILFGGGRKGRWLIVLGLALSVMAFVMLMRVDSVAQYIAPAAVEPEAAQPDDPAAEPADSLLMTQINEWRVQRNELGEGAQAGMSAAAYGMYVSSGENSGAEATIMCVGEGWFDVHPRYIREGYLFSEAEHSSGEHKAVLDEELAFELFPTDTACGKRVNIDGVWYDVIGVVRRADSPGDTDDYRVYIPLYTAAKDGMQTDFVQLDCIAADSGVKRALESVAADVLGEGTFCDTEKEVMRVTMMPRILFIVFALYAVFRILGAWNRRTVALVRGWFEEVKRRYFREMLPGVILRTAGQILGYCALALAAWGILRLIIGPMYVFTEWIPEVIVEWEKIAERVTGLMRQNAAVMRYQTREYASITMYGALIRWGVICLLTGSVLYKVWPGKTE